MASPAARIEAAAPVGAPGPCSSMRFETALPSSVAATDAPIAVLHAIGPSGRQPKKWLTPGVWIKSDRAPADAMLVNTTGRLNSPDVMV
jgi:hypothetical protein